MTPSIRDERGLVGRVIVTWLVVIVVFGLAAIEGGSILFTSFKLGDVSQAAATAGAGTWESTHDFTASRKAARDAAHEQDKGARVSRFRVNAANGEVTVTVEKKASTFLVQHVSWLRKLGIVHSTAKSGPPAI